MLGKQYVDPANKIISMIYDHNYLDLCLVTSIGFHFAWAESGLCPPFIMSTTEPCYI